MQIISAATMGRNCQHARNTWELHSESGRKTAWTAKRLWEESNKVGFKYMCDSGVN